MPLHRIRLELARDHEFPDGSPRHGYDFVAPLDADGRFSRAEWRTGRRHCTMRRFWQGQPDETGHLIHTRDGHWVFSSDPDSDADDEPIFRFDQHVFRPGEYVSVTEHDGKQRTFRIAAIVPEGHSP